MIEQKYYAKLRQEVCIADQCGYGGIICHTWLSKDYDFSEELFRQAFTKSELAEIMDGALYTQTLFKDCIPPDHVYYGSGEEIVSEWINPLIELVPVEGNE